MPAHDSNIRALVAAITKSYNDHPETGHWDLDDLPNREEIIEIIHRLRELLFPGYFGKQNLNFATIEYTIGDLLIQICDALNAQLTLVLRSRSKASNQSPDVESSAREITGLFLAKIPALREILATDVKAAFEGDPAAGSTDEIIFSYPGVFAITVHRIAHELYKLNVPMIPRIMSEYAHSTTGIDIHAGAIIGSYFFIDHGTGVVIGETAEIGKRVKIYQGVTLGALSTRGGQALRGAKRHPTIGDDVTVYSGASILGGETVIGDGVVIGSNAFVTRSVPEKTKVSVKSPELQFKDGTSKNISDEFSLSWEI